MLCAARARGSRFGDIAPHTHTHSRWKTPDRKIARGKRFLFLPPSASWKMVFITYLCHIFLVSFFFGFYFVTDPACFFFVVVGCCQTAAFLVGTQTPRIADMPTRRF